MAGERKVCPPSRLVPANKGSTQMSKAGSTVGPAPLVACSGGTSDVIEPRRGVAIIGHSCRVGTQIDDSRISQTHLRAVSDDGRWRIVGNIPRGMFVGGRRGSSVTVSDKTLIRFGDPPGGKALTFEVVRPSDSAAQHGRVQPSADLSDDPAHNAAPVAPDPGVVRAGAAAAARRRELDISQRSLAADGIINAGALIAFEKGRSWPRERTRAKLEEVLQWPAGTIARIRRGEPTEPTRPY